MAKVFNVEKYGKAVRKVLTALNTRKGEKINWVKFSSEHKLSNNFGAALTHTGLVVKCKGGEYKTNIVPSYVTKSTGLLIARVIKEHELTRDPKNLQAFEAAKAQLMLMKIAKDPAQQVMRGKKTAVVVPTNPLSSFSTDVLITELRNRVK
jgi:hypothetical protein